MSGAMHFLDHFMSKRFCPGFREGLIVLLIKAILLKVQFRVDFAIFSNLALLKILSLVTLDTVQTFFLIDLSHAMPKILNTAIRRFPF